MHKKYAKDGLAVVSVNVDEDDPKNEADQKTRDDVVKFLEEKNATFTNLVLPLRVSPSELIKPLDVNSYPTTFVYDRTSKLVKRFEGEAHKEIEQLVKELLKK